MNLKTKLKIAKKTWKDCGPKSFFNLGFNYFTMTSTPDKVFTKPLYIQIEPTLNCNLKCKMCYGTYKKRPCKDMTFEDYKKTIDQFPSSVTIHLQGLGEPFLHKDVFKMIQYTKFKKLNIGLTTNATLITDSIIDKILESKLDYLEISMDGATAKTYEDIRAGANFKVFIDNVRKLSQRLNSKVELKAIVVVMKENYQELPNLIKLLANLKIPSVLLIRIQYWDEDQGLINSENKELDQKIKEYMHKAETLAQEHNIHFDSSIPTSTLSMGCKRPWLSTSVTVDGYITPCCRVTNPNLMNFGNILKENFKKIWNNSKYKNFRKLAKQQLSVCKNCEFYYRDPMTREKL